MHNKSCTCDNCPRSCKQELTFKKCPEWVEGPFGLQLKDMKVMILGIDGFLGWALALWLADNGFKVSGVDNFARRNWVSEIGADSIIPVAPITDRLTTARKHGWHIDFHYMDIIKEYDKFRSYIEQVMPDAIVHYAECPSAPYSMIDIQHARYVQMNNILGTLNALWAIKDICPNTSLIKLGTMGEYGTPMSGRPIFEGFFEGSLIWYTGGQKQHYKMIEELTPRNPASIYHLSKAHDSLNIYKLCNWWGLRSIDIMQGVIYGCYTPQTSVESAVRTRLDIDEYFGTVINRFCSQAILGHPLTVYGKGGQTRGYLTLEDAMQCMTRLILHPPTAGEYEVINQIDKQYSINELAGIVRSISKDYGLSVNIKHIENPRVEAEEHPYNPIHRKLTDKYGFVPKSTMENEIIRTLKLLSSSEIKERIEILKDTIMPKTKWE